MTSDKSRKPSKGSASKRGIVGKSQQTSYRRGTIADTQRRIAAFRTHSANNAASGSIQRLLGISAATDGGDFPNKGKWKFKNSAQISKEYDQNLLLDEFWLLRSTTKVIVPYPLVKTKINGSIWLGKLDEAEKVWKESLETYEEELTKKDYQKRIKSNFRKSYKNAKQIIELFVYYLDDDEFYIPEFSIDSDGEIDLEWYGRKGARFGVTVGANGILYWAKVFHGTSASGRVFLIEDSLPHIITESLQELFDDRSHV